MRALLLLAMVPALALSAPTVAVVGVHGAEETDEELRELSADLQRAADEAGLSTVSGPELASLLGPARQRIVSAVFLELGNRSFEEGRILYERAQFQEAADALAQVEGSLQGVMEHVTDPRLTIEAPLLQGLASLTVGDEAAARSAFERVLRRDPNRQLDELQYPPRFVEFFEEARTRLQGEGIGTIAVPSEGRIYVDGRAAGVGPRELDVPPGRHTVLVDAGAAGRAFSVLDVVAEDTITLDEPLTPRGLAAGDDEHLSDRSGRLRRYARAITEAGGADLLLLAAFDPEGDLALALYSQATGTFTPSLTTSLDGVPGERWSYLRDLLLRIAGDVQDDGAIRGDVASSRGIAMRLGRNPVLTELLYGAVKVEPPQGVVVDEPEPRKGPHPAGVVAAVVGGVLGGVGAGVGIWAATRPEPSPPGTLVIVFP